MYGEQDTDAAAWALVCMQSLTTRERLLHQLFVGLPEDSAERAVIRQYLHLNAKYHGDIGCFARSMPMAPPAGKVAATVGVTGAHLCVDAPSVYGPAELYMASAAWGAMYNADATVFDSPASMGQDGMGLAVPVQVAHNVSGAASALPLEQRGGVTGAVCTGIAAAGTGLAFGRLVRHKENAVGASSGTVMGALDQEVMGLAATVAPGASGTIGPYGGVPSGPSTAPLAPTGVDGGSAVGLGGSLGVNVASSLGVGTGGGASSGGGGGGFGGGGNGSGGVGASGPIDGGMGAPALEPVYHPVGPGGTAVMVGSAVQGQCAVQRASGGDSAALTRLLCSAQAPVSSSVVYSAASPTPVSPNYGAYGELTMAHSGGGGGAVWSSAGSGGQVATAPSMIVNPGPHAGGAAALPLKKRGGKRGGAVTGVIPSAGSVSLAMGAVAGVGGNSGGGVPSGNVGGGGGGGQGGAPGHQGGSGSAVGGSGHVNVGQDGVTGSGVLIPAGNAGDPCPVDLLMPPLTSLVYSESSCLRLQALASFLATRSPAWMRLSVSPSRDAVLNALPGDVKLLSLQISPDARALLASVTTGRGQAAYGPALHPSIRSAAVARVALDARLLEEACALVQDYIRQAQALSMARAELVARSQFGVPCADARSDLDAHRVRANAQSRRFVQSHVECSMVAAAGTGEYEKCVGSAGGGGGGGGGVDELNPGADDSAAVGGVSPNHGAVPQAGTAGVGSGGGSGGGAFPAGLSTGTAGGGGGGGGSGYGSGLGVPQGDDAVSAVSRGSRRRAGGRSRRGIGGARSTAGGSTSRVPGPGGFSHHGTGGGAGFGPGGSLAGMGAGGRIASPVDDLVGGVVAGDTGASGAVDVSTALDAGFGGRSPEAVLTAVVLAVPACRGGGEPRVRTSHVCARATVQRCTAYGQGRHLPPCGGPAGAGRDEWRPDDDGRDYCVTVTGIGEPCRGRRQASNGGVGFVGGPATCPTRRAAAVYPGGGGVGI